MDVKQIERLEALPDEWRKRAQEAEDDGWFTAAEAFRACADELSQDLTALLQLARAVNEALDFDDLTEHDLIENGGSCTQEWINGWNARNAFLRESKLVALVPVPVKEGG